MKTMLEQLEGFDLLSHVGGGTAGPSFFAGQFHGFQEADQNVFQEMGSRETEPKGQVRVSRGQSSTPPANPCQGGSTKATTCETFLKGSLGAS